MTEADLPGGKPKEPGPSLQRRDPLADLASLLRAAAKFLGWLIQFIFVIGLYVGLPALALYVVVRFVKWAWLN